MSTLPHSVPPSPSEGPREAPAAFRTAPFRPSAWAPGPHLQTLVARFLRAPGNTSFERRRWETPDGDFLDLDWGVDPGPAAPIALVMHGLEGSSTRGYVRNVCRELTIRGIRPVALNFRGCSGEPNRRDSFYHSGATADPAFVLERIRETHPDRRVGAVGFSLGGNILLKLMGEREDGGRSLVDAAVAMSVPYDLAAGCDLLEQSAMGRAYSAYFLRSLKRKVRAKESLLAPRLDVDRVYRARTLRDFDDLLTAPVHGFADAEEYYAASSSKRFLEGIGVPTLLLHAEDDPFLPSACIPREEATSNHALDLLLHSVGGHVGFLEGPLWRPRFWADERTADFLALQLGANPRSAPTG